MSRRSSTRNIKLVIMYDGTHYSGWQSQKNADTVQRCVESALRKITGRKVKLTGAGRTDSGVHAIGQVANFKTHSKLDLNKIKDALNSHLSGEILIVSAGYVPLKFDAQRSARSKNYRYTVTTERFVDPFIRHFASRFSYPLNMGSMRRAARALTGRHDFKSFQASGSSGSSESNTVRTIKKIKIEKRRNLVYIDIRADGFLYNMVRIIAGTLLEIGRGKMPEESIKEILLKRDRRSAGPTAPALGLCLVSVEY
ncbi:MAG: tRNA pseudouridine(38-40) synthase TruA [Candidatus Omnitrophica bacterium]|nr:tRNA pseudouridine(38-40) synthase TruA [Candidatus Omnitrophota bacterium]